MEPEGKQSFGMATQLVVKMRANMADAPYVFEKGAITSWHFHLAYAQLSAFMPVAHHYLAASRLPYAERDEALQVLGLPHGFKLRPFKNTAFSSRKWGCHDVGCKSHTAG